MTNLVIDKAVSLIRGVLNTSIMGTSILNSSRILEINVITFMELPPFSKKSSVTPMSKRFNIFPTISNNFSSTGLDGIPGSTKRVSPVTGAGSAGLFNSYNRCFFSSSVSISIPEILIPGLLMIQYLFVQNALGCSR